MTQLNLFLANLKYGHRAVGDQVMRDVNKKLDRIAISPLVGGVCIVTEYRTLDQRSWAVGLEKRPYLRKRPFVWVQVEPFLGTRF